MGVRGLGIGFGRGEGVRWVVLIGAKGGGDLGG